MTKLILVTGATGNQGGSVAKHLAQFGSEYKVRCLTRDTQSAGAQVLTKLGTEVVQGDLTDPSSLTAAMKDVWGVFAVTNFYDPKIINDPYSEEKQGRNLARAAKDANVKCYIWSTMPSSRELSGGAWETRLYEGKHNVDAYVRELGLPSTFLYTGNFYENMVLRGHMHFDKEKDCLIFKQPVILPSAELTMLYVEKDLSAIVKAIFDHWDVRHSELDGKYLQASNARITPQEVCAAAEKVTGKKCEYVVLPTTGVPERDTMFKFYNDVGMHPGVSLPDPQVLKLGIKFHNVEDFVRDKLCPHFGLTAVA